jgi:hypothetical protein
MARELQIELRGCELARQKGQLTPKVGTDGWPDRLHVWAPGRHFWVEWKQPDGTLTEAQRQRIPRLQRLGEPVFIFDSSAAFAEFLEVIFG